MFLKILIFNLLALEQELIVFDALSSNSNINFAKKLSHLINNLVKLTG